jgi:hypothetical protein
MKLNMFQATHRPSGGVSQAQLRLLVAPISCQAQYAPDNFHQLHVQQPSTYEKPEAAGAVLGS